MIDFPTLQAVEREFAEAILNHHRSLRGQRTDHVLAAAERRLAAEAEYERIRRQLAEQAKPLASSLAGTLRGIADALDSRGRLPG